MFLTFFLVTLLTGCSFLPSFLVNELNFIQGYGYDLTEKDKLEGTYVYPVFKGGKEPPTFETITGHGDTSKEVRQETNGKVRFPLVSGQIRLLLFGKSLATKGIYPVVDTINRDPAIGTLSKMAIVDGKTKDLLLLKMQKNENMALYIQDLLEQNMTNGNIPHTDFNTFMYQYSKEGLDPFLPILKKEGDDLIISSIALLKDDRIKTQIPKQYHFIFKNLVEKGKHGMQQFTMKNDDKVVIEIIHSKPKYTVKIQNGKPTFNIQLKIKARLQQYSSSKPSPLPKITNKITKQIEGQLEKQGKSIINKFKKNDVDPLGLGSKYKAQDRNFRLKTWKEDYPNAKVNLRVNVKLVQTGILD